MFAWADIKKYNVWAFVLHTLQLPKSPTSSLSLPSNIGQKVAALIFPLKENGRVVNIE